MLQIGGNYGAMMIKGDVEMWIGSWNRKKKSIRRNNGEI